MNTEVHSMLVSCFNPEDISICTLDFAQTAGMWSLKWGVGWKAWRSSPIIAIIAVSLDFIGLSFQSGRL